jgi:hypothetical protein
VPRWVGTMSGSFLFCSTSDLSKGKVQAVFILSSKFIASIYYAISYWAGSFVKSEFQHAAHVSNMTSVAGTDQLWLSRVSARENFELRFLCLIATGSIIETSQIIT